MKYHRLYFALTLILVGYVSWGQSVNVQSLYVLGQDTESVWSGHELNFPFVILADKPIQHKINQLLLEEIFDARQIDMADTNSIKQAIDSQATDVMSELTFEVSLNKGGLLQIDITQVGTGAYSFGWIHKFLINTRTGNRYALIDLVSPDKQTQFGKRVFEDQKDSLNTYLLNIQSELRSMGAEEATFTVTEIGDLVQLCYDYMDVKSVVEQYDYSVKDDTIYIDCNCGFPRYALVFQPYYRIPYTVESIKEFLRPEIYQQLISNRVKK